MVVRIICCLCVTLKPGYRLSWYVTCWASSVTIIATLCNMYNHQYTCTDFEPTKIVITLIVVKRATKLGN